MLHIGHRNYELVRAFSGFSVSLGRFRRTNHPQNWMLEAHYVPADDGDEDGEWEYLRLTLHPFEFTVRDWRELTGFGIRLNDELNPVLNHTTFENLLAGRFQEEVHSASPGDIKVTRGDGYFFTVELDGFVEWHGREEDFRLLDQLPFHHVLLHNVPINAADPLAAARAMVAAELNLTETAGGKLTPNNPRPDPTSGAPLHDGHTVLLPTPWRARPA